MKAQKQYVAECQSTFPSPPSVHTSWVNGPLPSSTLIARNTFGTTPRILSCFHMKYVFRPWISIKTLYLFIRFSASRTHLSSILLLRTAAIIRRRCANHRWSDTPYGFVSHVHLGNGSHLRRPIRFIFFSLERRSTGVDSQYSQRGMMSCSSQKSIKEIFGPSVSRVDLCRSNPYRPAEIHSFSLNFDLMLCGGAWEDRKSLSQSHTSAVKHRRLPGIRML